MKKKYNNIFIVESIEYWIIYSELYKEKEDLVLTLDFALKNHIEKKGGDVYYVDKLCEPRKMQLNNIIAAEFNNKWYCDLNGNDIFEYKGVSFGFAFRIEIWSEYLYYIRLRANLEEIKNIGYQKVYITEKKNYISEILKELRIQFITNNYKKRNKKNVYYFDIHKYMEEELQAKTFKKKSRDLLVSILSKINYYKDVLLKQGKKRIVVYAQIYYPTKELINRLVKNKNIKVVTSTPLANPGLKKYYSQRLIPLWGKFEKFEKESNDLLEKYKNKRNARMILENGTDISIGVYKYIDGIIQEKLIHYLHNLDSIIKYDKINNIEFEIMISNLGMVQTLVDCVLKKKNKQSFLIINGLLCSKYLDEAKYASYINSYGVEIKKNYFDNAKNVICLGDPRMDQYADRLKLNRNKSKNNIQVIGIGTSGFNNIDLISHVAIEFDFINEILSTLREIKNENEIFRIKIKVRPNCFKNQYNLFVEEYFNDLDIEIVKEVSMITFLENIDLYISIYSQTLFEASCLKIPSIYYKIDHEYLDKPFDGKSELVTVKNIKELKKAYYDFKNLDPRYNNFMQQEIMEKYIGPLDGRNTERNLKYIYSLLNIKD